MVVELNFLWQWDRGFVAIIPAGKGIMTARKWMFVGEERLRDEYCVTNQKNACVGGYS